MPVLVEKPIAATSSEGEELAHAAESSGLVLAVGHVERFNPAVGLLRELIDAGAVGPITSCVARRVGVMPPRVRDADIVVDLAVHDIDVLSYLLGSQPDRVRATGGRAWLSDRTDHAEILLDYGGVGCFIQVNWLTPVKIRTLAVTGEGGYCELNYVTQEVLHYRAPVPGPVDTFEEFVRRYGETQAELVSPVRSEPCVSRSRASSARFEVIKARLGRRRDYRVEGGRAKLTPTSTCASMPRPAHRASSESRRSFPDILY